MEYSLHLEGTQACQSMEGMACHFFQARAPTPISMSMMHVRRREFNNSKGQAHNVEIKTKKMVASVRSRLRNWNINFWEQLLRFSVTSS